MFVAGISASYFGIYKFAGLLAVLLVLTKHSSKVTLLAIGLLAMEIDSFRHNQTLITKTYKNVEITGTVEKSSQREKGTRKYTVSHIQVLNKNLKVEGMLMVYCNSCRGAEIPSGSVVAMKSTIVPLPEKVYPTGYNVEGKYRYQGYSGFAFANRINVVSKNPPKDIMTVALKVRSFFKQKLDDVKTSNQVRALVEALFLGEKSRISNKTNDDLRKVGLSHAISISGMHISIMMMLCYQVFVRLFACSKHLRLAFNIRQLALFPSLLFSFLYLMVADMPVAGVRSFIMIAFAVTVYSIDAKPKLFASVLFSGLVLLAIMPHELFFASFQLSFLAVLSFSLIIDRSYKIKNFFLKYCYSTVRISIIVTLVTAPVVIYHFGGISLVSPVANILIIPLLTFIIMPAGVAYFILTIIPYDLFITRFFCKVMVESIKSMLDFSDFFASFQLSFLSLKDLPLLAVFLILGGILIIFIVQSLMKFLGLLAVLIGLIIFIFNQTPDVIANANSFVFREGSQYYIIGKKDSFARSIWRSKLGLSNDFLDGTKFCNEDGICMTDKITYVREGSKIKKVNNNKKCTDILVSRVEFYNLKKLDCDYKVIITRDALSEKPYIVLKYTEVKKS